MSKKSCMAAVVGLGIVLVAAGADVASAQARRSDPSFKADPNRATPPQRVGGEDCSTPPTQISSTPFLDSDDTCGNINDLTTYGGPCGLALPFPYGGEDLIYRIDLGTGNNVGYSADLTGSSGDLALFLIGTCGDGPSCVANSADLIGPGQGPEVIDPVNRPNGDYYLYVDSYYDAGQPGSCGTYTLSVTGVVPLEMLDFSVN